jgi:hypothetical protein
VKVAAKKTIPSMVVAGVPKGTSILPKETTLKGKSRVKSPSDRELALTKAVKHLHPKSLMLPW